MYTPFQGLMQLSSAPLRNALAHLGQYGASLWRRASIDRRASAMAGGGLVLDIGTMPIGGAVGVGLTAKPARARAIFLDYLRSLNALHEIRNRTNIQIWIAAKRCHEKCAVTYSGIPLRVPPWIKYLVRYSDRQPEARALHWSNYFRIQHRQVAQLRIWRICIAVDAAHIDSPFLERQNKLGRNGCCASNREWSLLPY
jgi:hypothetical protein